jgi:hypothetical protein
MAERGRSPGFAMSNEHRDKIKNSNILNALIEHIEGKRDMAATQVTAALGLLRKVMPDLAASENKTEHIHRYVARVPGKAETAQTWQQEHSPSQTIQ